MALLALVLLPQITLDEPQELPHKTLKAEVELLPQTTDDPHSTDWPEALLPQITELPHTTEVPQTTELPQRTELPFTSVTWPVFEL